MLMMIGVVLVKFMLEQWLSPDHLAVGMSSGVIRLFQSDTGEEIAAVRLHPGPITAIRLFPTQPLSQYEADLWLICQSTGTAISVPYYRLVPNEGDKEVDEPLPYTIYQLPDHESVTDLSLFSRQPRLLDAYSQQAHNDRCFFITTGSSPMLAFYALGGEGGYYRGIGELVSAVRRRITSAVVGTVGSLLPWGYLRGGNKKETDPYAPKSKTVEGPVSLSGEVQLVDGRRRTQSVVLDPSERLAAVTDGMGRVMLVDVWSQTVIRMWKGHRDAQCGWMEVIEQWHGQMEGRPQITEEAAAELITKTSPRQGESPPVANLALGLYLVIYSPQRSLMEIWRMRHGGCVKTLAVPSGKGSARLVTVYGSRTAGFFRLTKCFLVRRGTKGGEVNGFVQVDMVLLSEEDIHAAVRMRARGGRKEDQYYVMQFREMLSKYADVSVPMEPRKRSGSAEVEQALLDLIHKVKLPQCIHQIVELLDDQKSGAARFGPSFHKQANLLSQDCHVGEEERAHGSKYWAMMRWLKARSRLLEVYELLFELKPDLLDDNSGCASATAASKAETSMEEALSWVRVAISQDADDGVDELRSQYSRPISIPAFIEECGWDIRTNKAFFRNGTSTQRLRVVKYLMRPLLCDVFAVQTLDEVAQELGWSEQEMMAVIGEWFVNVPLPVVIRLVEGRKASSSPLLRYLHDHLLGKEEVTEGEEDEEGDSSSTRVFSRVEALLDPIYQLCMNTTQLEQAMVLAVVCGELLKEWAEQAEARTYGRVSSAGAGERWQRLTRQLRVALFVSHRLGLKASSRETVSALNVGSSSLYGMLASDLLSYSSSAKDCMKIEKNCSGYQHVRWLLQQHDHQIPAGTPEEQLRDDGVEAWSSLADEKWKMLLDAATGATRHPLLLYFTWHNQPRILGCHCAKVLVALWGLEPSKTAKLALARDHLAEVAAEDPILAGSVSCELWLSTVGPKLWAWLDNGPKRTGSLEPPPFLKDRAVADSFLGASLAMLGYIDKGLTAIQSGMEAEESTLASKGLPTPLGEIWPNTEDRWTFEARKKVEACVSNLGIATQSALLKLLQVVVMAQGMWDILPQDLVPQGIPLTGPSSLSVDGADDDRVDSALAARRRAVIVRALESLCREGAYVVYVWAEAVGIFADEVRREHVMALLSQGQDVLAEDLIAQVAAREQVDLLAQAVIKQLRARLSGMIRSLQKTTGYARILASLDADTCQWVLSYESQNLTLAQDTTASARASSSTSQRASLTGTHNILIKLLGSLASGSSSFRQAQALATLTNALLSALHPQSSSTQSSTITSRTNSTTASATATPRLYAADKD